MPELPEVETVRRGLSPHFNGVRIQSLTLNRGDLRFPFPDQFREHVDGSRVVQLRRRAKYLIADLDTGHSVLMHLGMSGSFRVETDQAPSEPLAQDAFHHARGKLINHDHVVFNLETGERIIYNDPRRFGFMLLHPTDALDTHPMLSNLGVEPGGNQLHASYLAERFATKKTPLKAALLDQRIIAGLGNIYVCEALWRAKLSPKRIASTLVRSDSKPTKRLDALTQAIKGVIAQAIDAGGSSLRDHIKADGSMGYFQNAHAVYDQEGCACPRPSCQGVVKRIVQSNRSSFYCASCQR